ncbi:MAG: type 1 glutamine amidotransferase domain-containing protein [Chlamydiales bacterium]
MKAVILVHDLYQELELHYPYLRLLEAGWEVIIAGEKEGTIYKGKYGYPCKVDVNYENAPDCDAVIIPGGFAPDRIRQFPAALSFVAKMHEKQKTIAFICHGGWVAISAKILSGKKATGYIAIKDDLENAGATFLDQEVVVDGNLISSRTPADLPAFMKAILA